MKLRAALISLLTAALAAKGAAAVIGEAEGAGSACHRVSVATVGHRWTRKCCEEDGLEGDYLPRPFRCWVFGLARSRHESY
jgi:hypothetical protein